MKNKNEFYCAVHPDEPITNYCCLLGCQTPLCPDCIDEHNKRHKSNGVFPEIDTINRVTQMCEKKSSMVVDELQEMLERLNSLQCLDVDSLLGNAKNEVDSIREKIIDQINLFFDNLYEDYSSKITGSVKKVMDFGDLKRRLIQVNEEMSNIRDNLYGNNIFEAIKCVSHLDDQSLLQSFEKEIDVAVSKSVQLPTKFGFNEVQAKNFTNEFIIWERN